MYDHSTLITMMATSVKTQRGGHKLDRDFGICAATRTHFPSHRGVIGDVGVGCIFSDVSARAMAYHRAMAEAVAECHGLEAINAALEANDLAHARVRAHRAVTSPETVNSYTVPAADAPLTSPDIASSYQDSSLSGRGSPESPSPRKSSSPAREQHYLSGTMLHPSPLAAQSPSSSPQNGQWPQNGYSFSTPRKSGTPRKSNRRRHEESRRHGSPWAQSPSTSPVNGHSAASPRTRQQLKHLDPLDENWLAQARDYYMSPIRQQMTSPSPRSPRTPLRPPTPPPSAPSGIGRVASVKAFLSSVFNPFSWFAPATNPQESPIQTAGLPSGSPPQTQEMHSSAFGVRLAADSSRAGAAAAGITTRSKAAAAAMAAAADC